MSTTIVSSNMSLVIPVQGVEPGPDFANDINASLLTIDSHNHSSGQGVQIGSNGLSINADLPFNSFNLTLVRSVRFTAQASPLALGTDLACSYVSGVDLYFNDGNGNQIRITQSGGVAGTPGSIGSLTSPASVTYVSGTPAFVFQSDTNTAANIDAGSYVLRNITASSNGITLNPPNSLAANYSLTLPAALPASTKIMTCDASGNVGVTYGLDGTTIVVNASVIGIATDVNLPGDAVNADGKNLVVSNTNTTKNLAIVRGAIGVTGTITSGEGFTVSHTLTGIYVLTWTTAFGDTPAVVVTPGQAQLAASAAPTSGTSVQITIYNTASLAATNASFSVVAIGMRA